MISGIGQELKQKFIYHTRSEIGGKNGESGGRATNLANQVQYHYCS